MSGSLAHRMRHWLLSGGIPVTKALIVINVLTLFWFAFFRQYAALGYLQFHSLLLSARPWTAFTYPLLGMDALTVLLAGYWLWIAGGSLERAWGSGRFAVYFFAVSAISAVGLYLGALLSARAVGAPGLWLPLAGLTVAFAALNPEQQILFFFVIPLKLKYLGLISAGFLLLYYARFSPLIGVLSLLGCGFSYLYVRRGLQWVSTPNRGRRTREDVIHVRPRYAVRHRFSPLRWIRNLRERKRLKDLFHRSGMDDE